MVILESKLEDIANLTLFRKSPGTRRMMEALPQDRFTETRDAVLVEDRVLFLGFDIPESLGSTSRRRRVSFTLCGLREDTER